MWILYHIENICEMSCLGDIINGKKIEISYQKAFKMVSNRVMEMLGKNTDENKTFEPPKNPVDKEKSRAFGSTHPIWLPGSRTTFELRFKINIYK